MNKLPEKLVLLRKYYNLSQGDIATRMHVPVTVYMQWENGNTICEIQQLKELADLFGIQLDDLLDNTKTIVIPEPKIDQSVNIPFNGGQDINATQTYGDGLADTMQTQQFSSLDDGTSDAGSTRVMDSSTLKDSDDDTFDEEEEDDDDTPVEKPKKKKLMPNAKKKKQSMMIVIGVAVLVAVIAIMILFFNKANSSLKVGSENRIALGDTYSLYVDNQGNVKKYGSFNPSNGFSSAVQVSAFDNHAAALLKNGKVVSSDGNSSVDSWKNIKYIAAGKDHTVGVTKDGKVECAGNESACKVSGWSNISTVYAGNGFTIGLTNDGAVKASGKNTDAVSNLSNIRHISVSDNMIVVTKKDGTVTIFPIGSASTLDTSSWTDIQSTAAGSSLVAGLKKDGTVSIETSDTTISDAVSTWKNIKYIAANGGTLIGIDTSGKMHGAGDNSHNQYVDTTNSSDGKSDNKLGDVKNIQVNATTANVVIKWDVVENASYYEVTISTTPETTTKTSSNSASIAASELTDGSSYTITVTAKSDSDDVEDSSASMTFTYQAKSVQLSTPTGITSSTTDDGWTIQWTAVEHADSYKVSIDGGQEFEVNGTSYTDTGIDTEGNHTVTVKACSTNPTYTESEAGTATLQYVTQTMNVNLYYLNGQQYLYNTTVQVKVGLSYSWADLDKLAGGYAASQGWTVNDGSEHIYSSTSTINIQVTPSEAPVEGPQANG